jgi:hypothetical protein
MDAAPKYPAAALPVFRLKVLQAKGIEAIKKRFLSR